LNRAPRPTTRALVAVVVAAFVVIAGVVVVANLSSFPEGADRGAAATSSGAPSSSAAPVDPYDPALALTADADRKRRAAQITSTFENATLELQYDYVENIGDGRGITAGRAGFTSATGDLLQLVQHYTQIEPDNPLAEYLPALEAVNGSDSEEGLDGFAEAWAEAARDPEQRALQDALVDQLYFTPAMRLAAETGIVTPLGQAIFWDTMIQHGLGGETGTRAMIAETEDRVGSVGAVESEWLDAFLDVRLEYLYRAYEDTTENADSASESRIGALRSFLEGDELALELPLTWDVYGSTYTLPAS
jgi:chitosanase